MLPEYPFTSHFHQLAAGRLHYLDEGEGPVVVLVHGNPTWSYYYRNVVAELRSSHRVIAVDHLGCGLSSKPQEYAYTLASHIANLESLLDSLGVERFSLVVHDWGGAIGMGLAAGRPQLVDKIVVLNTAAFRFPWMPKRIAVCRIPVLGEILVRGMNGFAWPATFMAVTRPLSSEVKRAYLKPYNNWHNRVAVHRFVKDIPMRDGDVSMGKLMEIEDALSQFHGAGRMLILWGGRDFCFNMTFYQRWCSLFPEAEHHCYEDAGHYVLEDAREEVVPRIAEFFRRDA